MNNVPLLILNNINHKNRITFLSNQCSYNTINRNINKDKRSFPSHFLTDNDIDNINEKL